MSIQGKFCFCSNEMQLCRIWRAKQKDILINNRNNLKPTTFRGPTPSAARKTRHSVNKYINSFYFIAHGSHGYYTDALNETVVPSSAPPTINCGSLLEATVAKCRPYYRSLAIILQNRLIPSLIHYPALCFQASLSEC